MYMVLIQRCTKDNPLTGRARYRVVDTLKAGIWAERLKVGVLAHNKLYKQTTLLTNKPQRKGTFITPRKAIGI